MSRAAWLLELAVLILAGCGPSTSGPDGVGAGPGDVAGDDETWVGSLDAASCRRRRDAGTPKVDAGTADAGTVDAGTVDAGTVDAGTVDASVPDAGPSIEILDYYVSLSGLDDAVGRDGRSLAQAWRTLQFASTHAAVDDSTNAVIHIAGGTYEPVSVTKAGLTFENLDGHDVVIAPVTGTKELVRIAKVWASAERVTTFKRFGTTGAYTGSFVLSYGASPVASDNTFYGVNVYDASNVRLQGLTIRNSPGFGVAVSHTAGGVATHDVVIEDCTIEGNGLNGVRELRGDSNLFQRNRIQRNGHDGQLYNGDGVLLQGTRTRVLNNTISLNGDNTTFEHGIYVGPTATGYEIADNTLEGNAASGIKAGGQGRVHDNWIFGHTKIGLVLEANSGDGVEVDHNTVDGDYLYGVWTTRDSAGVLHDNVFGGAATTWVPESGGSPPAFMALAYATRLELRANVFAAPGRTYAYKIFSTVPAAAITSSDDNSFSPGTFAWPAVSVGDMDFATWKRLTGLDGASTCSGTGC